MKSPEFKNQEPRTLFYGFREGARSFREIVCHASGLKTKESANTAKTTLHSFHCNRLN